VIKLRALGPSRSSAPFHYFYGLRESVKFGCESFVSEYERYHTVMFSNYASQARLIPLEAQLDDSSHWETLQAEKNLSVLSVHCPFFSLLLAKF